MQSTFHTLPYTRIRRRALSISLRGVGLALEATRRYSTATQTQLGPQSQLPQQTDLLDVYRGLMSLGRVRYSEEQVRVVMQLRRLSNTLRDYAPSAFVSEYDQRQSTRGANANVVHHDQDNKPWYTASTSKTNEPESNSHHADLRALVRLRSHAEALEELRTPKGVLLTGPPGCGKSFLVDLWFSTLSTPYKTRKHYSELVLEIYRGVWEETKRRQALLYSQKEAGRHLVEVDSPTWTRTLRDRWRKLLESDALPKSWKSRAYNDAMSLSHSHSQSHGHLPPISFTIAYRFVTKHWLLAFDELQLLDVSSAGLLADVLTWFWRMGGIVVASSNKVPDDLYRGGVQRERLEPFVEALKARCPVLEMPGRDDWRRETARASNPSRSSSWFTKNREDEFWRCVSKYMNGLPSERRELNVFGRRVVIPRSVGQTCIFSFSELCEESLGPADYITIAAHYRTIVLTSIPILRVSAKNQSRRFISLIDALYEARCRVIALAEAEADDLFFPDAVATDTANSSDEALSEDQLMAEAFSESRESSRPNISSYADKPERPAATSPLALDSLSIFSGEEERFAYKRAVSRIIEMTSDQYVKTAQWNPLSSTRRSWENAADASSEPKDRSSSSVRASVIGIGSYFTGVEPEGVSDDFASEASGESEASLQRKVKERPNAPRVAEDHMWGVREDWGRTRRKRG